MAQVAAVHWLGESIVQLLRTRRDLGAAAGTLGPVPSNLDITQHTIAKLSTAAIPTTGLGLVCYNMTFSDHRAGASRTPAAPPRAEIALELMYMLVSWSAKSEEEQANLVWAMLELSSLSVLDASTLKGGTVWENGEKVQIAPEPQPPEEQFKLWDALGQKYRMSTAFRARVLRIRGPREPDHPSVVASRFNLADEAAVLAGEPV
ncbi:Pvc16 family protein [Parerythrobacter jejuensis]|uniref:DUF4255 domain-containing protein n=1 Tax=Parerythrobacter jejuensis TaxID=795812 RepID=A0A845AQW1_9SPHN|nr:Pvc16 family protein [Parerythrobacter jejuensis]MXP31275.1 DUF4255 domain-containing protein [Parerythrobacter jejuensis]MXP34035.1 DUF4255 domain-containing protein [Parerythrobacter jejuensis]